METVVVKKLLNGFVVESSDGGIYCERLNGVVAELHRILGGTVKLTPDQVGFIKGKKSK